MKDSKKISRCSGVLVSSRLVLTAAHCVCLHRSLKNLTEKEKKALSDAVAKAVPGNSNKQLREARLKEVLSEDNIFTDGMDCPSNDVGVNVIEYPLAASGVAGGGTKGVRATTDEFWAQRIVPHQDFKLVHEKNGTTAVFKQVDLAIVVLDRPVEYLSSPARLASQSEVKPNDRVVMVGYGHGRIPESKSTEDHRVVGESVVVAVDIMGGGVRATFYTREEMGDGGVPSRIYIGDSGGPCFSKANNMLVGIATAVTVADNGKEESIFTSVFPHRDWIKSVADKENEGVD